MPTAPPLITTLPTAPSTADMANFDARADAQVAAVVLMVPQLNAANTNVYNNALEVASSASSAATSAYNANISATNAATASGAAMWVSGTTYVLGAAVWSPVNHLIYRRIVAGAGSTDPSGDPANWASLGTAGGITVAIVTGTTMVAAPNGHYVLTNVAATTVTLPAGVSGDTVVVTTTGTLLTNVITPNGAQTIMETAGSMTIDKAQATVTLRFLSNSWRIL